jgi:hypothetical protein
MESTASFWKLNAFVAVQVAVPATSNVRLLRVFPAVPLPTSVAPEAM